MVGFTALFEKIGPDDSYAIMDQIYEILIHKVHDYEGTVNEMTGDGITLSNPTTACAWVLAIS